jgi:DNA-binding NarL/FixJ family response regulator
MKNTINIAIAEDQLIFRKALIQLVNSFQNCNVIFDAGNGNELLSKLANNTPKPDIIILDLQMPELNGIETTKILNRDFPDIKIIILTVFNEEQYILHMIECGAHAYMIKNSEPEEFERAIKSVFSDGFYFTESILNAIKKNTTKVKKDSLTTLGLTDFSEREIQILQLICNEYTAEEIGEKLFISPRTVEGHRNRMFIKSGCKNTAGLVVFAIKNNLVVLI